VPARPYVVLSAAVSADGYLDDAGPARLVLSSPEDLERVDELRAGCDAILVGAGTIRADDPALQVRSRCRRVAREERGQPPSPIRITLSRTGESLHGQEKFFAADAGPPLVYLPGQSAAAARARLGAAAAVIAVSTAGPAAVSLAAVLADLAGRGISRLLVEGGSSVLGQFLASGLADELQLAVAPFFVGEAAAPRLLPPGRYPQSAERRMKLASVTEAGDMAVLQYLL
jgi:5-amino-6-(5-phosphoribosylamino)uracil reductase